MQKLLVLLLALICLILSGPGHANEKEPDKRTDCAKQEIDTPGNSVVSVHDEQAPNETHYTSDGEQLKTQEFEESVLDLFFTWLGETRKTNTFLVIFTGLLFVTSLLQGILNWRAVQAAHRSFVATHRPRLRVRAIFPIGHGPVTQPKGRAWITVVNVGETTAQITGIHGFCHIKRNGTWVAGRPQPDPKFALPEEESSLESGESHGYFMSYGLDKPAAPISATDNSTTFFAVGAIKYTDEIGTIRQTGFAWSYDPVISEFRKPKGEDEYNYED